MVLVLDLTYFIHKINYFLSKLKITTSNAQCPAALLKVEKEKIETPLLCSVLPVTNSTLGYKTGQLGVVNL